MFLDLAWMENDATRYLTQDEPSRTLGAVAARIVREFGAQRPFAELVRSDRRPGLEPAWFEACAEIERAGFDWRQMNRPWLVPVEADEARACIRTELYICEGLHSTIVLAVELVGKDREWIGLETVVSLARGALC